MEKILIIGPILPDWNEILSISNSINFLAELYQLDFLDPLEAMNQANNQDEFIAYWQEKLQNLSHEYNAFIGFSLGGVVLQQCFDRLLNDGKPIVLFSTPSFTDSLLQERLRKVIELADKGEVKSAIKVLNEFVFYPNLPPKNTDCHSIDYDLAAKRLSYGLNLVLGIDSRNILNQASIPYLNLIGEDSKLINTNNTINGLIGSTVVIPFSGMRVLQDNIKACKEPILKFLEKAQ